MRRALPALLSTVAALALSSTALPASADPATLDRPRQGADAIAALGDQLAAVAAEHGTTAATLRERLRSDRSLWVDPTGRLFYVDEAPQQVEAAGTATSTAAPTAATALSLHSRPGSHRIIYLDFTGVGGTYGGAIGGAWSRTYTGGDGVAEPYSLDSSMAFSSAELADIYSIWQRVAEDFAPFAIDVTTEEPAPAAIDRVDALDEDYGTQVAITSSSTGCGCGGVAYVGVFDQEPSMGRPHAYYQPAFVYNRGAKYAAEAATHEAGHNLGLSHDGTASAGYYEGQGEWAPIMGVGYYRPISQWSRGEYAGASNTEDDYAVIAANGGTWLPDETGPATLTLDGQASPGVLGLAGDSDEFTVTGTGAPVTISVRPADVSPDLDVELTLSDAAGALVAHADPAAEQFNADVAGGLGAIVTAPLDAGRTYRLIVVGVGKGDPATNGYSTYGSVGAYTVKATAGTAVPVQPPAPPGSTAAVASGTSVTVTWADVDNETSIELQRLKYNGSSFVASGTVLLAADRTSHVDSPGAGTWQYQVRSLNAAGPSAFGSPSVQVTVSTTKSRGRK